MDLSQVEIKLFIESGAAPAVDDLIRAFHGWIRDQRLGKDKLLIDVTDYSHVKHGPGVMIIGHDLQYRLDDAEGRPGLLFARKRDEVGPARARLLDALRNALEACRAMETDPVLGGAVRFRGDLVEVRVMNRLAAPNTDDSYDALRGELEALLGDLYAGEDATVERHGQPAGPLSARVTATAAPPVQALLERLPAA